MIRHTSLGKTRFARLRSLAGLIRNGKITFGGHRPSKIYGQFDCRAGKRMKPENRVFFRDEAEAIERGYRPCAVCLPESYGLWKNG